MKNNMWKSRIWFGLLFTVVGIINSQFHNILNLIAAIFMFLFSASSFNLAQKEYYESKQKDKK